MLFRSFVKIAPRIDAVCHIHIRPASSKRKVDITGKIKDYIQLTKLRLSALVVFSAATGYIIATGGFFQWASLGYLMLGGYLVTGASNGFNQVFERNLDKLMDRTAKRPIPDGRMSVAEALIASVFMGIAGVAILWTMMNPLCGIISLEIGRAHV